MKTERSMDWKRYQKTRSLHQHGGVDARKRMETIGCNKKQQKTAVNLPWCAGNLHWRTALVHAIIIVPRSVIWIKRHFIINKEEYKYKKEWKKQKEQKEKKENYRTTLDRDLVNRMPTGRGFLSPFSGLPLPLEEVGVAFGNTRRYQSVKTMAS